MKKLLFGLVLLFALQSCQSPSGENGETTEADTTAEMEEKAFGEPVSDDNMMNYDELITKLEKADSVPATIKASVEEVCQVKGCWMNVKNEAGEGEKLFVQFKDYGFFMPKDLSGNKVLMEGYAYREVTSVEDLKHFAEDEGKSQEEIAAITEPEEQLKFMASGVRIVE